MGKTIDEELAIGAIGLCYKLREGEIDPDELLRMIEEVKGKEKD